MAHPIYSPLATTNWSIDLKKAVEGQSRAAPDRCDDNPSCFVRQLYRTDLDDAVEVHMEAFAGYMNAALGRGYVRSFLSWFCSAEDGIALCACVDDLLVGYVVGAPLGYGNRLNRDLAFVVARALAFRPWLFLRGDIRRALLARFQVLARVGVSPGMGGIAEPVKRAASLVGIGVSSAARGKGAGASLVLAFEAEAQDRGLESMRLSVYRENHGARRVYERSGWALFDSGEGDTVFYEKDLEGSDL